MNKHTTFDPNHCALCECELFGIKKATDAVAIAWDKPRKSKNPDKPPIKLKPPRGVIRFEIQGGELSLTVYDGSRAFTHVVESCWLHNTSASIYDVFYIDGVDFHNIITAMQKYFDGDSVAFSVVNGLLSLQVRRTKYTLVPSPITEADKRLFDANKKDALNKTFDINGDVLWRILQTGKPFMSRGKKHKIPSGLRLRALGDKIVAISGTDKAFGYSMDALPKGAAGLDLVIPTKAVAAIMKPLGKNDNSPVKVSFNKTDARFDILNDVVFVSTNDPTRATPDFADYMDAPLDDFARVDCQDLGRAIKRIQVIRGDESIKEFKSRPVKLSFDDCRMVLSVDVLHGTAEEELGYEPRIGAEAAAVGVDPQTPPVAVDPLVITRITNADKKFEDIVLARIEGKPDHIHLRYFKDARVGYVVAATNEGESCPSA